MKTLSWIDDGIESVSSKGTKSQLKCSRKSDQSEELEFEVADSDMPQDQEGNLDSTTRTNLKLLMTLASSADKLSKIFDELMSTPIDFSAYIMESARDVYSKRIIIAVIKLQIVECHNYKHLDWIIVRRDDDKLYTFKEGDFNRPRIQDIKDMLLLLVQGKLTNLTVEERLTFNRKIQFPDREARYEKHVSENAKTSDRGRGRVKVVTRGVTPPKKVRKFKKLASPKLTNVLASPKEPTKKSKRVKRPAKKSTNAPIAGVVIIDTPGVSVSKKKAPAKTERDKCIELLSDAVLLEYSQLKKAFMKSKQETHKLQASGSSEGADFELEVPDESKAKSSDTSEGTDSEDENESDDNNDKGNENDDDGEEEKQEEKYVHTPDYSIPTDEETDDENKEFDDEEYDDLYKDVNVRSKVAEHEEVGKGDVDMTNVTHESGSQEKSYEQVVEDAHMTLTTLQKTEGLKQSSSVSSDFASKFLILDNVSPVVNKVAYMMNVKSTLTLEPTTEPSTTLIPALLDFSSLFEFNHRVSTLKKELSPLNQVDHSAQILISIISQILTMVDDHLSTRIGFATQTTFQSYTAEFEKKAQEEKDRYINLVEKSIKDIIKDEVKSQLPQILPKEVSNFSTPVIQGAINELLKNVIVAKSSSQSKSTYEAVASL
ncbi:hypothetical protein Tco_0784829 [Tanacetum coccineum]